MTLVSLTRFLASPIRLAVAMGLSIFAVGAGTAWADDVSTCVAQPVSFDGIKSLTYAIAAGPAGSRIYLHAKYPADCQSDKPRECKSPGYVVPGDVVAVSKTCGAWSYAQYLGKEHVTAEWIATSTLLPRPPSPPADNSITAAPADPKREPDVLPSTPKRYPFVLTKGNGVPVCEAYLQRMNQTDFSDRSPPYCGRPESTLVPGFSVLHRRWMSRADYVRLFIYVDSFLETRELRDFYVHHTGPNGTDEFGPPGDILPEKYLPTVSVYDPRVDIDNDGTPDNVALWNEGDRVLPQCIEYPHATAARAEQSGLVLRSDGSGIDQERTRAVFGHPDGEFIHPTGPEGHQTLQRTPGYRSIGDEVSVFEYRGTFYFDTFYTRVDQGDFRDQRRDDPGLHDTLGVFLNKAGRTQQVCEYQVKEQGD